MVVVVVVVRGLAKAVVGRGSEAQPMTQWTPRYDRIVGRIKDN